MSQAEVDKIKTIFTHFRVPAEFFEHVSVITSAEAAEVRGSKLEEGVKSILLIQKEGDGFAIVDLPAHLKIDLRAVSRFLGWKDCRLATPEQVLEQTGCEIGGVPPLAHKNKLRVLVDHKVFNNKHNEFNCGLRTVSARVKSTDLRRVFETLSYSFGNFSK